MSGINYLLTVCWEPCGYDFWREIYSQPYNFQICKNVSSVPCTSLIRHVVHDIMDKCVIKCQINNGTVCTNILSLFSIIRIICSSEVMGQYSFDMGNTFISSISNAWKYPCFLHLCNFHYTPLYVFMLPKG